MRAIIDFYGVVDITMEDGFPTTENHQQPDSPEGYLIGRKNVLEHLDIARQTNPMAYLDGNIPPILIAHGTKDRLVAFKQSVKLYKALKDKNKDVVFYRMKGADHGGPMFFCEDMLEEVIKFIKKNISNA